MNITEFLEARIAEDEAVAKLYDETNAPMYIYDDGHLGWPAGKWDDGTPYLLNRHTGYAVAYDPACVLAECAAKRAIIKLAEDVESMDTQISNEWGGPNDGTADEILAALAAVYADHPDYQQEWAL